MEFSLSLDWCGNSSCIRCGLDLHIHSSNDRVCGLLYLLTWMVWCRSSSWSHCCIPSIVLGSIFSEGFYCPGVVYRWLLWLGPVPKTFQWRHLLYSFEVVQSIAHHCISHRSITAFHVDAASTWYVLLVLGGKGFWWWCLTWILFM